MTQKVGLVCQIKSNDVDLSRVLRDFYCQNCYSTNEIFSLVQSSTELTLRVGELGVTGLGASAHHGQRGILARFIDGLGQLGQSQLANVVG